MAAGALVDRANIQASRATDALESLVANRGGQRRGTAVIQQDQVEVLRAIAFSNTGPHGGVRVHTLRGGRARQQLEEDLQVLEGRNQLLNAHDGNEGLWQGQAHAAIALGLHDVDGSGFCHTEVGAGNGNLGLHELLAQELAGSLGQFCRLSLQGVIGIRHLVDEDIADLRTVAVDSRNQNVGGLIFT